MDERIIKATRIRLTKEFLDVYVNLELLLKGSYTLYSLAQELENYLRCLNVIKSRPEKRLIVCYNVTLVGLGLRKRLYLMMQLRAISLDWTVEELQFWVTQSLKEDTWQCQAISRMEKL